MNGYPGGGNLITSPSQRADTMISKPRWSSDADVLEDLR